MLRPSGAEWVARELGDEIRDIFPNATLEEVAPEGTAPTCDLLIMVFSDQHQLPLHDVIYARLADLDRLLVQARSARYVMLYRATWRAAEVVSAARLRFRVRRLKLEYRIIDFLQRSPRLRQVFRPLYGQGN